MSALNHITVTSKWAQLRLKSPALRLFTQPFIQTQIKENIKAPRHWPLCGEFTGTGEFPAQRASYAENVFHLMTSSWDNGLSSVRSQAIIWSNADLSSPIGTLRKKISEFLFRIQTFSLKKMPLEMSSEKCRPFCLALSQCVNAPVVFLDVSVTMPTSLRKWGQAVN